MKNHTPKKWATQRALAGLMAAGVAFGGFSVVNTAPAFAQVGAEQCTAKDEARKQFGEGTLHIEEKNYAPGDVITVKGTGFKPRGENGFITFKINANKLIWPEDQSAGANLKGDAPTDLQLDTPLADGTFETKLVLPKATPRGEALKSGQYEIRAVGGNDQQGQLSVPTKIHILAPGDQAGACGTIPAAGASETQPAPAPAQPDTPPISEAQPGPTQPTPEQTNPGAENTAKATAVEATTYGADGRGVKAGQVNVKFKLEGFPAGQDVVAKSGDKQVEFAAGRQTAKTIKVGEDGTVEGTVIIQPGQALEGEHKIGFRAGTEKPVRAEATVQTESSGNISNNAAQGEKAIFTGVNLAPGAKITAVGTAEKNWLAEGQTATANEQGVAEIKDVQIPADAAFRAPVQFSYEIGGNTVTRVLKQTVAASQTSFNEQNYEINTVETAPGLYQSVVNDKGEIFVARSNGRPPKEDGSIYKLDAATLKVKAEKKLADGTPAAYGIGLDNKNGLVWITNTRSDQVAVYRQDNLELVHQWEKGSSTHPRDVVVDETTGLAYVSIVDRRSDSGRIDVYSAQEKKIVRTIEIPEFPSVMSMDLDQKTGNLYTVSLSSPKAARINVRNNDDIKTYDLGDKVDRASGVAYVPGKDVFYVASQGTGNAVVVDAKDGKIIAEIPTGAGALNAKYNATDNRVYVTNRAAGTITVIDVNTNTVVANLPAGANANHASVGPDGAVYAVNKGSRANDTEKDEIHRYKFNGAVTPGTQPGTQPGAGAEAPGTQPGTQPGAGAETPAPEEPAPSDNGSSVLDNAHAGETPFQRVINFFVGLAGIGAAAFGITQLIKHLVHIGVIPRHLVPPHLH